MIAPFGAAVARPARPVQWGNDNMSGLLVQTQGNENWVLSDDGAYIYLAGNDGYLRVFDTQTGAEVYSVRVGQDLGAISLSPDGSQLAIVEEVAENVSQSNNWTSNSADVSFYVVDLSSFAANEFTVRVTGSDWTFADVVWSDGDTLQLSQNTLPGWSGWASLATFELATASISFSNSIYYAGLGYAASLIAAPDSDVVLLGQLGLSSAEYFLIRQDGTEIVDNGVYENNVEGYAAGIEAISGVTANDRIVIVTGGGAHLYDGQMNYLVDLSNYYPALGGASGVAFSQDGERIFFLDRINEKIVVVDAYNYTLVGELTLPGVDFQTLQLGEELVVTPDGEGVFYNTTQGIAYATLDLPDSGTDGDDTLEGSSGDDIIDGRAGNDIITGLAGDDWLIGGTGTNRIDGGEGFDIAAYDEAAAGVTVDLAILGSQNTIGAGRDTFISIEGLSGSIHDDRLWGDAGDNGLLGYDGNDLLIGRGGHDILMGENGDDILRGNDGNDLLIGGEGNDRLDGGPGTDEMEGGNGNDTYYVDSASDIVTETATGGNDTVYVTGFDATIQAGIERLVILSGAWDATGNFVANTLIGSDDDNVLSGLGGNDTLLGGLGRDFLYGGDGADSLDGEGGSDRVYGGAGADTIIGGAGWDNLWGDAGDDTLDGGNGTDWLFGGDGIDTLSGGTERDILYGQAGNDILRGGDGDDTLHGGNDNDDLAGDAGNDWLFGGAGADRLEGGIGDDRIQGSYGRDVLAGGAGADTFIFSNGDSAASAAGADRIRDFSRAEGDRIDLSAIDANGGAAGDGAFIFVGTTAFSGAAGELRFTTSTTTTLVEGDMNGDGVADFSLIVDGTVPLTGADFIL